MSDRLVNTGDANRKPRGRIEGHRLYEEIAAKHGATVQEDTVNECKNRSWCAGKEIFMGQYEDEEIRDISFFHELGHIVAVLPGFDDWAYCRYSESMAWRVGLELAGKSEITFSVKALVWAANSLSSYFYDDKSEGCPTRHLPQALRDAGLSEYFISGSGLSGCIFCHRPLGIGLSPHHRPQSLASPD